MFIVNGAPIGRSMIPHLPFFSLAHLFTFIAICSTWPSAASTVPKPLPVEAFASLPEVSQMALSDDGYQIASLVRVDVLGKEGTAVYVLDFKTGKRSMPLRAENKDARIRWLEWANGRKLLISVAMANVRYGTPVTGTGLLVYDTKTEESQSILPPRFYRRLSRFPQFKDRVVDFLPQDPNHILLAMNTLGPGEPAIYKVNVNTRKYKKIQSPREYVTSWVLYRS